MTYPFDSIESEHSLKSKLKFKILSKLSQVKISSNDEIYNEVLCISDKLYVKKPSQLFFYKNDDSTLFHNSLFIMNIKHNSENKLQEINLS